MRVILKEDVESLGIKGDIVKVADGYARNYLIPRRLAEIAISSNIKRLEEEKKVYQRKLGRLKGEAASLAKKLESITCTFSLQAGEDDKLFGSVTSMDIERHIKEAGYSVDKKQILLPEPIKKLGIYTVPLKLHPEVTVDLKVSVVKEEVSSQ